MQLRTLLEHFPLRTVHHRNSAPSRRQSARAGAVISLFSTLGAAGALWIGAEMARHGTLSPSRAALGFFATLALAEAVAPLRRGVAEIGGMRDAARRVTRWLSVAPTPEPETSGSPDAARGIQVDAVTVVAPGTDRPLTEPLSLVVAPGETVALTGRSGAGKSTLLNAIAGLTSPGSGMIGIAGVPLDQWREQELRDWVGYLPQRCALVSGTVAENLRLAAPEADDNALHHVLESVALEGVVRDMGGLDAPLGEGGKGLSGGEARRLALGRVLLRAPRVLLLDEPTEGLDRATAERVLKGIHNTLPDAAILVAAHRKVEREWCERCVNLN